MPVFLAQEAVETVSDSINWEPFDLNDDGISDQAYRPNGLVDQILWKYPTAKLLLGSPVMQILRWVQSEFPAIHPGGVRDSAPLMVAPEVKPNS